MNSKSLNRTHLRNEGFTLIEVLISIFLLVVISLGIYKATSETYKLRDVLSAEADFYGGIRLSMNVMDHDISMIYTPKLSLAPSTLKKTDPNSVPASNPTPPSGGTTPDLLDSEDQQAIVVGDREKGTLYWTSVLDKTGVRMSRFIGKENSMSFISVSNLRVYKDSRESVFAKIAFELSDDKNSEPELQNTKTLVKRINSNAFAIEQDDDNYTRRYPILQGIQNIKFSYYNHDKDSWTTSWDSDSADYKGLYPDLIKVELKVIGPQNLHFEGLYKFRPEIPIHGINAST